MCANAMRLPVESVGLNCSHCAMLFENAMPPIMMTFCAPVARTEFTRVWKPATWYGMPVQVPPFFQQFHPAVLSKFAANSGNGSLNRSNITAVLFLNAFATLVQNA